MAKILVTSHLGRHFRIFGHYDYKVLLEMGHEVHIAANFKDDIDNFDDQNVTKHQIDFIRNPFSIENIKAMRQLEKLLHDNYYDIIHCQSPSGGAITRLAARKTKKKGSKILYTAHGLHFFQGAPKINWIIYYHIEKWLGYFTDCIITINSEDYNTSIKKLSIKDVRYIHGVGIDLNRFLLQTKDKKEELRREYGYGNDDFILIYAGELSYRKHQDLIIDAVSKIRNEIPNLKLLLAGSGNLMSHYKQQVADLQIESNVEFLGYRKDVMNLMMLSDMAVSASRQEGLPVNVMEAMATGLPLVVTECRGNKDLVLNNYNGLVVDLNSADDFANAILQIYNSDQLRQEFKKRNCDIIKTYSIEKVKEEMKEIYSSYI